MRKPFPRKGTPSWTFSENQRLAVLEFQYALLSMITVILFSIFRPGSIVVDAKLYITNMNDDKRLKICKIADNLLENASMVLLTRRKKSKLNIRSLGNI